MTAPVATKLQYIHLRAWPNALRPYLPSYSYATAIQTTLQERLFAWKNEAAAASRSSSDPDANTSDHPPPPPPPPPPSVLCFTPMPTYTLGRRQTQPLEDAELRRLQKRLTIRHDTFGDVRQNGGVHRLHLRDLDFQTKFPEHGDDDAQPLSSPAPGLGFTARPAVTHSPRGGLTTYHGPGQLVFWPVLDLKSPLLRSPLNTRDYACLLEQTTIAALRDACSLNGFTTSNPGVWVENSKSDPHAIAALIGGEGQEGLGADWEGRLGERGGENEHVGGRKIAALGVHLRRNVTGLGVAINVAMPTTTGGPTLPGDASWNPWARIDACGLGSKGKGVTSVAAELLRPDTDKRRNSTSPKHQHYYISMLLRTITSAWVKEFAARLGLDGFEMIQPPHFRFCVDQRLEKS